MGVRVPKEMTLSQIQNAIRDLEALIDGTGMTGTGTVDFKNRRIINAGKSQAPQDYVTRVELENARAEIGAMKAEVVRRISSAAALVGNAPATPSAPVTSDFGFGYYLLDVPADSSGVFGDFYNEVKDYITTYHCWFGRGYSNNSSEATSTWLARIAPALTRAVGSGKRIHVLCDVDGSGNPWTQRIGTSSSHLSDLINTIVTTLQPYWNNVATIDLSDEGITDAATADLVVGALRAKIASLGLGTRPIGTVLSQNDTLASDLCRNSSLDYVGIEAYVEPPAGTGSVAGNKAYVVDFLNKAYAAIDAGKKIYVTLQAYNRNGAFTDVPALVQLQYDVFDAIKGNGRVLGMLMFSYGRAGGTRAVSNANPTLPTLRSAHQDISKQLVATTTPTLPPGDTCGGSDLPPECKRYCRGGDLDTFITAAMDYAIAANPGLFQSGVTPPTLLDTHSADLYVMAIVARINSANTTVQAIVNPEAGQEIFIQRIPNPTQLEIYAAVASSLQIRRVPGAYIATCIPGF